MSPYNRGGLLAGSVALWALTTALLPRAAVELPKYAGKRPLERKAAGADRYGDALPDGAVARLGTLRLVLAHSVAGAHAFTPDGKVVIGIAPGTIRLWNAATGKALGDVHETAPLSFLLCSTDGKYLAAATGDELCVWELTTGHKLHRFQAHRPQNATFLRDGTGLAAVGEDGRVRWWDLRTGKLRRWWDVVAVKKSTPSEHAPRRRETVSVASPDGRTVAALVKTAREYKPRPENKEPAPVLKVWDAARGKELWQLTLVRELTPCLAFSSDGRMLALLDGASAITLRDSTTGKVLRRLPLTDSVGDLAFSADGSLLASGHWTKEGTRVCLWNVGTGNRVARIRVDLQLGMTRPGHSFLALSGDGKRLAVAAGRCLRLWDTRSGKETPCFAEHRRKVSGLGFSRDGRLLTTVAGDSVCRWDTATWRQTFRVPKRIVDDPLQPGSDFLAPVGENRYFKWCQDGEFALCELTSGKVLRKLPVLLKTRNDILLSANGAILIGREVTEKRDGKVILFDVVTGRETGRISAPPALTRIVAVSRSTVAWLEAKDEGSASLRLWDVARNKSRALIVDDPRDPLLIRGSRYALAPTGEILLTTQGPGWRDGFAGWTPNREKLHFWQVHSGKLVGTAEVADPLTAFAFSPDGRMLATAHAAYWPSGPALTRSAKTQSYPVIYLWETATGRLRRKLKGHTDRINALAFSTDGRLLASGSQDSTVLIWDVYAAARGAVRVPAAE